MNQAWTTPVVISIGDPPAETAIATLQAAAWALIDDWPLEEGPALDKALAACTGVMEGKRKADDARARFVDAAAEAGILIRS